MAFQFLGLDHVQLAAPEGCEQEARLFFVDLLGWTEVPKPEDLQKRGGVWFLCGSHQVHIGVQKNFLPATKAHPAFHVQNIKELMNVLQTNNIQITEDSARTDEGISRFYTNDPFGNRLEFLEYEVR